MPRLFTYIITQDCGSAPNPFNGICTLAICKPAIRRVAEIGDWVVGFASVNAQNNLSNRMICAMKVTGIVTMQAYDQLSRSTLPNRIPNVDSWHLPDRLGDSIYDYQNLNEHGIPAIRSSVHDEGNRTTDLGGKNVLISTHFYYFGSNAIDIEPGLPKKIIPVTQGHRSTSNQPYLNCFEEWIESQGEMGQRGWPSFSIDWKGGAACNSCSVTPDDETEEFDRP